MASPTMQWHSRKTTGIAELVDFPEVLLEDFEATHRKDAGKSLQNASAGIKFFPVIDRRVKTVSSNDPGVAEGPPVFSKPHVVQGILPNTPLEVLYHLRMTVLKSIDPGFVIMLDLADSDLVVIPTLFHLLF
jgi:hypothetical protein